MDADNQSSLKFRIDQSLDVNFCNLQIVGMAVFSFLVVDFYVFLGLLLGSRAAEITVTTIFSFVVNYSLSFTCAKTLIAFLSVSFLGI